MFLLVCIWIGKMSSRAAAVVATIVAHHGSPLVSWTNMSSASHFAIGQPKNHPPARSLARSLTAAAAASATASLGGGVSTGTGTVCSSPGSSGGGGAAAVAAAASDAAAGSSGP